MVSGILHLGVNLKSRSDNDNDSHGHDRASTNDTQISKCYVNDQAVAASNSPVVETGSSAHSLL
jgi:hypothetical protein